MMVWKMYLLSKMVMLGIYVIQTSGEYIIASTSALYMSHHLENICTQISISWSWYKFPFTSTSTSTSISWPDSWPNKTCGNSEQPIYEILQYHKITGSFLQSPLISIWCPRDYRFLGIFNLGRILNHCWVNKS